MIRPWEARYPLLSSPLDVGPMRLAHRVVCAPHQTEFSPGPRFTRRHVDYLVERAHGGAAWIITEPVEVHPSSRRLVRRLDLATQTSIVANWRSLVDGVHEAGARISLNLGHAGRNTSRSESGRVPWAPSEVPGYGVGEVPLAMTPVMIAEYLEAVGGVAKNAADAGFDGVELQATSDYLIGSFLSPVLNERSDCYGGSIGNRCRLLFEALERIGRHAPGLAVGLRLSIDHRMPGGWDVAQSRWLCQELDRRRLADYASLMSGSYFDNSVSIPVMGTPVAPIADDVRAVRDGLAIPVVIAGRITGATEAERLLRDGVADLWATARLFIADPYFVEKVRRGEDDAITRCLYCNQQCVAQLARRRPISCVQNPAAGLEAELSLEGHWAHAATRRLEDPDRIRVLVVGAGPAGLETAVTARRLGLRVRVVERAGEPGGQVLTAAALPGRAELRYAITPRVAALRRLGVRIETEALFHPELAAEFRADAVVDARGGREWRLPRYRTPGTGTIAGLASDDVVTLGDALATGLRSASVVLVDGVGTRGVLAAAEELLRRDCLVQLVTRASQAGIPRLVETREWQQVIGRLVAGGLRTHPYSLLHSVADGRAWIENTVTGATTELPGVDTVVLAFGDTAIEPLATGTGRLLRAGDCRAPSDIGGAIADGRRVVLEGLLGGDGMQAEWAAATGQVH